MAIINKKETVNFTFLYLKKIKMGKKSNNVCPWACAGGRHVIWIRVWQPACAINILGGGASLQTLLEINIVRTISLTSLFLKPCLPRLLNKNSFKTCLWVFDPITGMNKPCSHCLTLWVTGFVIQWQRQEALPVSTDIQDCTPSKHGLSWA